MDDHIQLLLDRLAAQSQEWRRQGDEAVTHNYLFIASTQYTCAANLDRLVTGWQEDMREGI